jgi:hypothetical protein
MKPVAAIPMQASKGAKGRIHPLGCWSEKYPKMGWITDEVRLPNRRIPPAIVYERCKDSLKKGRRIGRAPGLRSVTRWPILRRAKAFLFIFVMFSLEKFHY